MNIDTITKEATPKPIKAFFNLFLQSCNAVLSCRDGAAAEFRSGAATGCA
jgi:hypothetical protein